MTHRFENLPEFITPEILRPGFRSRREGSHRRGDEPDVAGDWRSALEPFGARIARSCPVARTIGRLATPAVLNCPIAPLARGRSGTRRRLRSSTARSFAACTAIGQVARPPNLAAPPRPVRSPPSPAFGHRHGEETCGLDTGGAVHCWRAAELGEAGDGQFGFDSRPMLVVGVGFVRPASQWTARSPCRLAAARRPTRG
jgi:hypothetical protein